MSVEVRNIEPWALRQVMVDELSMPEEDKLTMYEGLKISQHIYIGKVGGETACIWGIVTPSILSLHAGIWLYTTPLIKDHPFIFVRHSQIVIKELLKEFETIEGTTHKDAEHSKRWIRWLGAEFHQRVGDQIRFVIRRKTNG